MSSSFLVTVDRVGYSSKPSKGEVARITNRLKASGPVEVSPIELAEAIANGHTWVGGCFEPSRGGWGPFVSQRLFALDFDNDTEVLGPDGKPLKDEQGHVIKRDLHSGEEGFLDPWAALDRWRSIFDGDPLLMYPSFSFEQVCDLSQPPTKTKYRLVFDVGEAVTIHERAKDVLKKALRLFPEADKSCSNSNRLFFGSCGKVAVWSEGGVVYVKRA